MNNQTYVVNDFSGGMTDHYSDCPADTGKTFENLVITEDKKIESRPGCLPYTTVAFQVTASKVTSLINHASDSALLATTATTVYRYKSDDTWPAIAGPSGNNTLSALSIPSSAQWENQTFIAGEMNDGSGLGPVKVFVDNTGTYRLIRAGLPAVEFSFTNDQEVSQLISFANNFKSNFNAHVADAVRHKVADPGSAIGAANATDYASLITLVNSILGSYSRHWEDFLAGPGVWTYHTVDRTTTTQISNPLPPTSTVTELAEALMIAKELYNGHIQQTAAHQAQPVGTLLTDITCPPLYSGGFLYGLCYKRSYYVGSTLFTDRGPMTVLRIEDTQDMTGSERAILEGIKTKVGEDLTNQDTANFVIELYRSAANGTTLYLFDTLAYNVAAQTYTDVSERSSITSGAKAYITGATTIDYEYPPKCKFIHVVNDTGYYGGDPTSPTTGRQSIPGDIDSCPSQFFFDLADDITGIGSYKGRPIYLTSKPIYRIDGAFDAVGRGAPIPEVISHTAGCISHNSVVTTEDGLFWAGSDGFYWTDGYAVKRISRRIAPTYRTIAPYPAYIRGVFDSVRNLILWTASVAGVEEDSIFALDLKQGIREDAVFTTWIGDAQFNPTALALFNSVLVRANKYGYVFKHLDSEYSDATSSNPAGAVAPTLKKAIVWTYTSGLIDFGKSARKWVGSILLRAKNHGDLSVQVIGINDDGAKSKHLIPVRFRKAVGAGELEERRRFPSGALRCSRKQVTITNANTYIANSDDYGTATVIAGGGPTYACVLNGGFLLPWPANCETYEISFQTGGYATWYTITARNSNDTITISDAGNTAPKGTVQKWQIRGVKKNEKFHLLTYLLNYFQITQSHKGFDGDQGENE